MINTKSDNLTPNFRVLISTRNLCVHMETKVHVDQGKNLAKRWGFKFCKGVSSPGLSEGLMVMWDDNLNVAIKFMN